MWGVGCARLRRAGAGERAERAEAGDSGAERGEGSRESTGQRDSIADGTALRCGRVGSRHFQSPKINSSDSLFLLVETFGRLVG